MDNLRKYGEAPYTIAVVHGGPGAAGEMAPVARELSSAWGVLEPLQTATSLQEQIEELRCVLQKHSNPPVTLVGFSWGAWLSFMLAAGYPALVKKLVLIGSGPFEERYAAKVATARLGRLNRQEKLEFASISKTLSDPDAENRSAAFSRLRELAFKADAFDPMIRKTGAPDVQAEVFLNVWKEAAAMRRSGRLLELAKDIRCPVVAIHGDRDPHPAEGVDKPLSAAIKGFRFMLLQKCGHMPWIERHAHDRFYQILKGELRQAGKGNAANIDSKSTDANLND